MVFICVEMYVFSESNIICYVSLIKEKGSHRITSSCKGLIFKKIAFDPETASLYSTACFWSNTVRISAPLRD